MEVYTVAVDQEFLVVEYGLRAGIDVRLERRDDGRVLWRADRLMDEVRFYANSDPVMTQANREEALVKVAHKLAVRVMDQLLLGF